MPKKKRKEKDKADVSCRIFVPLLLILIFFFFELPGIIQCIIYLQRLSPPAKIENVTSDYIHVCLYPHLLLSVPPTTLFFPLFSLHLF